MKSVIASGFMCFCLLASLRSQDIPDSVLLDSVVITKVSVKGISLGSPKQKITEAFGTPDFYFKGVSETDGKTFYMCNFNGEISLILNENEQLSEIEYLIYAGCQVVIDGYSFSLGDESKELQSLFPLSYAYFMNEGGNALFLVGLDSAGKRNSFCLSLVIKEQRIYSLSLSSM